MKYSVIIPCYKCEATLEKTISSIQSCGLTDFEIILVDDGSPDGTPALCDRLAVEQGNVRVFHQPNGGVSSARNHGLAEAQGDYVWFFDSDDLVNPGSMTRPMEIIDEYAPDMLIFGMSSDFYHNRRMIRRLEVFYDIEAQYDQESIQPVFSELFHNNALSSSCNKLIKRNVMISNGISFDQNMPIMEDYLFVLQTIKKCESIYTLPQVIYRFVHVKSEGDYRAASRLSQISDLASYLEPFQKELEQHPQLMLTLYYMMLRQKLSFESPKAIARTIHRYQSSIYSSERYDVLLSNADLKFAERLRKGDCWGLYLRNQKAKVRGMIVRVVKRTPFYRLLKGSTTQRVRW